MSRPKPTSAENGRHSHGPITPEGKRRSSANSLRHGIAAKKIVLLPGESGEAFDNNFNDYVQRLRPVDNVELDLTLEIGMANWRGGRALLMERALLLKAQENGLSDDDVENSLEVLSDPRFATLQIYKSRIERTQQRALNTLIKIRRYFPDDEEGVVFEEPQQTPEPIPEPEVQTPAEVIETVASKPRAKKAKTAIPTPDALFIASNVDTEPSIELPVEPDDWPKAA